MTLDEVKATTALEERLTQFGEESKAGTYELPDGQEREALLEKVRQSENAVRPCEMLAVPTPRSK